jgi:hypothetical protein
MKNGGIETGGVDVYGITPRAGNVGRRGHVVVSVFEMTVKAFYDGVGQVKKSAGKAQTRRPNATGIRHTDDIEQALFIQWSCDEHPLNEIVGSMHLNPRKPLKGGGRHIVDVLDLHQ